MLEDGRAHRAEEEEEGWRVLANQALKWLS